ncbi:uncharacterized protein [Acropora muricata]|uniref:uncharacterized protein isoform X2 n=1 Tax=Acropora muricata TaxID=159855 RepID=UPI0034E586C9
MTRPPAPSPVTTWSYTGDVIVVPRKCTHVSRSLAIFFSLASGGIQSKTVVTAKLIKETKPKQLEDKQKSNETTLCRKQMFYSCLHLWPTKEKYNAHVSRLFISSILVDASFHQQRP